MVRPVLSKESCEDGLLPELSLVPAKSRLLPWYFRPGELKTAITALYLGRMSTSSLHAQAYKAKSQKSDPLLAALLPKARKRNPISCPHSLRPIPGCPI